MNKRKKYLILAIIVVCAFAIVGPLIINECYKSNSGYITLWSPADMLAYYGVVLGALVAIITVVVTIGFTRKQIQMENFLKQENEKWTKIEAIFANAIDKINPMHPLIETMDTGMKDPAAAITTFQKYRMMCKIALDQLNAHLCVNDYPKVKKLIDSICNATEIFDKISDGEIQAYSSLRDYSSLAVVKETLKIEKEHPGIFPAETIAFDYDVLKRTNGLHLDDLSKRIAEQNHQLVNAYQEMYRPLLQLKGSIFSKIYSETGESADNILDFERKNQ